MGDLDVELTVAINSMTYEEYKQFLEEAEESGNLNAEDYEDKAKLNCPENFKSKTCNLETHLDLDLTAENPLHA